MLEALPPQAEPITGQFILNSCLDHRKGKVTFLPTPISDSIISLQWTGTAQEAKLLRSWKAVYYSARRMSRHTVVNDRWSSVPWGMDGWWWHAQFQSLSLGDLQIPEWNGIRIRRRNILFCFPLPAMTTYKISKLPNSHLGERMDCHLVHRGDNQAHM